MHEHPHVVAICIGREARKPMESFPDAIAIKGRGLVGDRYSAGAGSYNQNRPGHRQVTLINARFVVGSGFSYEQTRRNIATWGVELMDLIGREFQIDDVTFRGIRYCDPCRVPNKLTPNLRDFKTAFQDRGGLVAEILSDGLIRVGGKIVPPKKDYG